MSRKTVSKACHSLARPSVQLTAVGRVSTRMTTVEARPLTGHEMDGDSTVSHAHKIADHEEDRRLLRGAVPPPPPPLLPATPTVRTDIPKAVVHVLCCSNSILGSFVAISSSVLSHSGHSTRRTTVAQ